MQAPKIGFVSLGCAKALVDSERILTQLRAEGYLISNNYDGADVIVVNTCGFIDSAREESMDAIGEALRKNGKVIVTGCLGAKKDKILEQYPNVLAVTGPNDLASIMGAIHHHSPQPHDPFVSLIPPQGIKLTPKHYAYLKISEGCNHRCSFCIIPSMRGNLLSRPIGEVMEEAEILAKSGVKELLVISQDTSAYGVDMQNRIDFWQGRPLKSNIHALAAALSALGIWIRLHYVYPYPHVDDLIPLMANDGLLPYLDIPFQHANQRILRAMRRPASAENNLHRIQKWRETCPDITLRSTFIVGFPGESEAEFEELLSFLEEARLDRVGCFTYSAVEGAAANKLPDHVPEEIKLQRKARLMSLQENISTHRLKEKVGRTLTVLVDTVEGKNAVARSTADAPDIDGLVHIGDAASCQPGDFIQVNIIRSDTHDLWGEQIR